MLNFFRRTFTRSDRGAAEQKPLLSEQQACEIAENSVLGTHHAGNMLLARLDRRDGRLIWLIGSASRGSGITVTIDDVTGKVMSCEPWGVR